MWVPNPPILLEVEYKYGLTFAMITQNKVSKNSLIFNLNFKNTTKIQLTIKSVKLNFSTLATLKIIKQKPLKKITPERIVKKYKITQKTKIQVKSTKVKIDFFRF
jgi:hypothetical protein